MILELVVGMVMIASTIVTVMDIIMEQILRFGLAFVRPIMMGIQYLTGPR